MSKTPEWASTLGQGSVRKREIHIEWKERRTLRLSSLEQDVGNDLVDLSNKFEERVIGEVLEREFTLSSVSGVLIVSSIPGRQRRRRTVFLRTACPYPGTTCPPFKVAQTYSATFSSDAFSPI